MTLREYSANTVLLTQDELPPGIFIIYSGSIKIFRSMSFRESATNCTESMIKNPIEGDRTEQKEITIAELGQGESIGDYDSFNESRAKFFAVTSMPSLVFVISKADITRDILYDMNVKALETPDDQQLRETYFQKQKWNIYKSKLIKTVKTEMTLSKSKWKTSLRSVTPQPVERLNLDQIHLPPIRLSSKSQSKTPVKQKIKYPLTDR
ncbi:CNBD2_8 [Blepharisma stoltei]|uniref:Cyclic nucleotide-binding domain-containing protein n=1 Tax=Blepharisma stoltei TaxID=1481888 RepID=A0AAU9INJ8_9CILI|nr:unnamed protein product [Blepharisma stoltei]